jgi:hypothetical protein
MEQRSTWRRYTFLGQIYGASASEMPGISYAERSEDVSKMVPTKSVIIKSCSSSNPNHTPKNTEERQRRSLGLLSERANRTRHFYRKPERSSSSPDGYSIRREARKRFALAQPQIAQQLASHRSETVAHPHYFPWQLYGMPLGPPVSIVSRFFQTHEQICRRDGHRPPQSGTLQQQQSD